MLTKYTFLYSLVIFIIFVSEIMEIDQENNNLFNESETSFYLTLPSSSSRKNSTPSTFTIDLESPIFLKGVWCCGLAQISIPHSWKKPSENAYIRIYHSECINFDPNIVGDLNATHSIHSRNFIDVDISSIDFDNIKNKEEFCKTLNGLIENRMKNVSDNFGLIPVNELPSDIEPSENTSPPTSEIRKGFFDNIKSKNALLFSWINNSFCCKNKYFRIRIPPVLAFTLGYDNIDIMRKMVQHLYIYTNLINSSKVGDRHAQLLRWLSVKSNYGDSYEYIFEKIFYFDVNVSSIYNVSIDISDITGIPINCTFGQTICTLHFKKKSF